MNLYLQPISLQMQISDVKGQSRSHRYRSMQRSDGWDLKASCFAFISLPSLPALSPKLVFCHNSICMKFDYLSKNRECVTHTHIPTHTHTHTYLRTSTHTHWHTQYIHSLTHPPVHTHFRFIRVQFESKWNELWMYDITLPCIPSLPLSHKYTTHAHIQPSIS